VSIFKKQKKSLNLPEIPVERRDIQDPFERAALAKEIMENKLYGEVINNIKARLIQHWLNCDNMTNIAQRESDWLLLQAVIAVEQAINTELTSAIYDAKLYEGKLESARRNNA
jgi:hypothetical protein